MPTVAGIDGCPSAWFAIVLTTETQQTHCTITTDLGEFYDLYQPSVIAIDIPIGLTDSGPRRCDLEARKFLKGRASCVFPAPIRPTLEANDRSSAHAISVAVQGKGVPAQAFGIYRKVLEVDNLLQARTELQGVFHEVHPELSFFAWNEDQVIPHPKKSSPGFQHRLSLVTDFFGESAYDDPRKAFSRSKVSDDDILDAHAALWSALRIHAGMAKRCPAETERDSLGLPMTMWF